MFIEKGKCHFPPSFSMKNIKNSLFIITTLVIEKVIANYLKIEICKVFINQIISLQKNVCRFINKLTVIMFLGPEPSTQPPGHYCEKCGKQYKLKSSLRKHIKFSCNKEPTFSCSYCNMRFYYKHHLQRHTLVHLKLS